MNYLDKLNLLNDNISKYDNIYIFSHIEPDRDAIFSKKALYEYIKLNFPCKRVFINHKAYEPTNFNALSVLSPNKLKKALGIVVDTAIASRCEYKQFYICDSVINIDHHESSESEGFCKLNIVDPLCVSTTELLAKLFYSSDSTIFSNDLCSFLYYGIITDSNCFTSVNTTADSLLYASKLVKDGNIDIFESNKILFSKDYDSFLNENNIKCKLIVQNSFGYAVATANVHHDSNIRYIVDDFRNVSGLKVWALFIEDVTTGLFEGTIRSDKKYKISNICERYNGGGHDNVCAVHQLSLDKTIDLINELTNFSKEDKQ